VNPVVGQLNFLLYNLKREVNHSLIKNPLKKIQLSGVEFLSSLVQKKSVFPIYTGGSL
jgi:hypothetical protein